VAPLLSIDARLTAQFPLGCFVGHAQLLDLAQTQALVAEMFPILTEAAQKQTIA